MRVLAQSRRSADTYRVQRSLAELKVELVELSCWGIVRVPLSPGLGEGDACVSFAVMRIVCDAGSTVGET